MTDSPNPQGEAQAVPQWAVDTAEQIIGYLDEIPYDGVLRDGMAAIIADCAPATPADAETAAALRLVELWRNSSYQGEALHIAPYQFLQPDGRVWRVTHSITGDFGIYASLAAALAAVDGDGEGSEG